jgi:short-subunit dehydrogenase
MVQYALITGASSGLGKAFAYELACKGINVLLVSLPNESLEYTARDLRMRGIRAEAFETDLSVEDNVIELAEKINQRYRVFMLINNAGIGGTCAFESADPDYLTRMIRLNITSTTLLTRLLLPNLKSVERGYILNVSSIAAFSPIGYKTVYPASKAFIHHFSRGLYQELKDTNVFVSVVNPGPMRTNNDATERIEKHGWLGRMGVVSPEDVAQRCIRQLQKRDTVIMLGIWHCLHWALIQITPIWIRLPLGTRLIRREVER